MPAEVTPRRPTSVLEHDVFAVQTKNVEGRHSDQSNCRHAEHDWVGFALVVDRACVVAWRG
jgi:hypothetical protein